MWDMQKDIAALVRDHSRALPRIDGCYGHYTSGDDPKSKPTLGRYWARQVPASVFLRIIKLFAYNSEAERCVLSLLRHACPERGFHHATAIDRDSPVGTHSLL